LSTDAANLSGRSGGNSFAQNPIVYFLLTDRFSPPSAGEPAPQRDAAIGRFHGGRFDGVTRRIREGWFRELGVNALWISAPYQQVLGWIPGANAEFVHEPYHGYWPLDFTAVEPRLGSEAEFRALVDAAHADGLRVVLDVVMGHAGYPDLQSLHACARAALRPGWETATPATFDDFYELDAQRLDGWWGPDWVRLEAPGYRAGGDDELTRLSCGLPKFLTEDDTPVRLPAFLRDRAGSLARDLDATPVRGYLLQWLGGWVRRYGIDGFRCDSVKHVDTRCWRELKRHASEALGEWRRARGESADDGAFWMAGEVFGQGIAPSDYYAHGFDSLINFEFQGEIDAVFRHADLDDALSRSLAWHRLDKLYARYAGRIADDAGDVLSYVSSHDTGLFDRGRLRDAAIALMLAPGGVQVFYGDESGRPPGPHTPSDPHQAARSPMNWDSIDSDLLSHWRKLGRFRARHVALARGTHRRLCAEPYAFARQHADSGDRVIVVLGGGTLRIAVGGVFGDGEILFDAYSGTCVTVLDGHVDLVICDLALLESASAAEGVLP
jgi:alpha-amylase